MNSEYKVGDLAPINMPEGTYMATVTKVETDATGRYTYTGTYGPNNTVVRFRRKGGK